jgi:hypothetical protein
MMFGLIVVAMIALALTTAIVHGAGNEKVMEKSLLTGSNVPVPVRAILERACQDCHSEKTVWPWYSHIPPVDWQIHTDVEKGRAFMDFTIMTLNLNRSGEGDLSKRCCTAWINLWSALRWTLFG